MPKLELTKDRPDLYELWAHLDFFVSWNVKRGGLNDRERKELKDKILLGIAQKLPGNYSAARIEGFLFQDFKSMNDYEWYEHQFDRVFVDGSLELKDLKNEQRIQIRQRYKDLCQNDWCTTPRSLRSRSEFPTSRSQSNTKRKSTATPTMGTLTPFSTTPKRKRQPAKATITQRLANQKRRVDSIVTRSVSSISRSQTTQSVTVHSRNEVMETPSIATSSSFAEDMDTPSPTADTQTYHHEYTRNVTTPMRQDTRTPAPLLEEHEAVMFGILLQQTLRNEINEKTKLLIEKENAIARLFARVDGMDEKFFAEFQAQQEQIAQLKRQNHRLKAMKPYLRVEEGYTATTQLQSALPLQSAFRQMKSAFRKITFKFDDDQISINSVSCRSRELKEFFECIICDEAMSNPKFSLRDLTMALTGASIHQWIFGSSYHPTILTSTPLLQFYRDYIGAIGGHEHLYNFDTAAHQLLVGDEDFESSELSNLAARYVSRLLHVIDPLFRKKPRTQIIAELRPTLTDIFRLALQIRSLSLVGAETYESIWPVQSTAFNRYEMETLEMLIGSNTKKDNSTLVKLCFCPGLRAFGKANGLVTYDAFNDAGLKSSSAKYTIPALVLL